MPRRLAALVLALLSTTAVAACGGDDGGTTASGDRPAAAEQRAKLGGADRPRPDQFPQLRPGDTLDDLADRLGDAQVAQLGLATTVVTPGHGRVAFGVIDEQNRFAYGPTALYYSRGDGEAIGPVPAPADLLVTEPAFRSRQAASEDDPFAAVYGTTLDFTRAGKHRLVSVTRRGNEMVVGAADLPVRSERSDPVPGVGEPAPRVATDTAAEAGGDLAAIDTRLPPARELHEASFADVVGKKPVALLFATPQLCQSRVCGPVVDVALQLRERYGDRVEFIHQEVYEGNDPQKGLREPLRRFGLPTEPWLFTIATDGTVAARLEGSFGLDAFERALQAAIARSNR